MEQGRQEIPAIRTPLQGRVSISGDKSVSFRALLLGPLAPGTRVANLSTSPLVRYGVDAITKLGVDIERAGGNWSKFTGYNRGLPSAEIYCGSSATLMRLATGLLAGVNGNWRLIGDAQLTQRPMERVAEPLRLMGAGISTTSGHPPLSINGGGLRGIDYGLPIPSAQVKSAIMLAALNAEGITIIRESIPARDHTERILRRMEAHIIVEDKHPGHEIRIEGLAPLKRVELFIPGDISSAAFVAGLAALIPGSDVVITDVLLNPMRISYLHHLYRMGADIKINIKDLDSFEPYGDVIVKGRGELQNIPIHESEIVGMIDEIPLLAMVGAFASGRFELNGAKELRAKETDRIAALAHNLRAMGLAVDEREDGFSFESGSRPHPCEFDSLGDHRMALACNVAGMLIGDCMVLGGDAALMSYPEFHEHMAGLQIP